MGTGLISWVFHPGYKTKGMNRSFWQNTSSGEYREIGPIDISYPWNLDSIMNLFR